MQERGLVLKGKFVLILCVLTNFKFRIIHLLQVMKWVGSCNCNIQNEDPNKLKSMQTIKAILIDDEERARNSLLAALSSYCPEVIVVAQASNVPMAAELIREHQPDLIFLDIEMPEYNGFELFQFVDEVHFDIIFVTAYSQYAIQAFEVSALDYLLKPIEVSGLQKAVQKVLEKKSYSNVQKRLEILKEAFVSEEIKKISLPMADGLLFVEVKDIVLLEADGAYTYVCLQNGSRILVSKRLKFFEDILSNRIHFFRPHRSHIVNLNFLKKYVRGENKLILDNSTQIALSRDLKQQFESVLKELKLN